MSATTLAEPHARVIRHARNAPAEKGSRSALPSPVARLEVAPAGLGRMPMHPTARGLSQAAILQMQRVHGNRHVQRMLVRQSGPIVQRCGGKPCNCSPEEQQAHMAQEAGEALQRLSTIDVAGEVRRSTGGGDLLHARVRSRLEPAMGVDLSHIRVHADRQADTLARSVDAEAFTTGNDIYFREGRYDPHSTAGLRLIAHEATHTVQQAKGAVSGVQQFGGIQLSEPGDRYEQEADQAADAAMTRVERASSPGDRPVQRLGQPAAEEEPSRHASLNGSPSGNQRDEDGTPRPVQRIAAAAGMPVIQRMTQTDRKPPFTVNFKPFANLQGQPAQQPTTFDRGDPFHDEFQVAPGTSGRLIFLVDMDWTRSAGGGGGGGGTGPVNPLVQACDPCPKLPPMLPDPELEGCSKQPDLCARRKFVDDLFKRISDDPCILISDKAPPPVQLLKGLCQLGTSLAGPVLALFVAPIINGVRSVINLIANNPVCGQLGCAPVAPGGGPGPNPPPAVQDTGTARATLETRYAIGDDRKITLFGPAPRAESNGVAAELETPVEFSRQEIPGGANIALQPMINSEVEVNRGGQTVKETHKFQHMWDIDLKVPQPPPPQTFCCGTQLFPFITGKDKFEDEQSEQTKLFAWFEGQDPRVKQSVFEARTPVMVAGRASRLGNHAFNLELAEKRATRVKQMMNDFGGSFASVDAFAFGELTATGADINDPHDRRADVKIAAEIEPPAPVCGPGDAPEVCGDPALPPNLGGEPVEGQSDADLLE